MPLHDVATLTETFRRAVLRLFVHRGLMEEEASKSFAVASLPRVGEPLSEPWPGAWSGW